MASGDWMKSPAWMANAGHFLAGYAVVMTALLWTAQISHILWVSLALVAYGVVKEGIIDIHFESGETYASGAVDFAGYMAGAAAAWIELLFQRGIL